MRGLRLLLATAFAIFAITLPSANAQYSVLYNFDPSSAGNFVGVLAQGVDGDLYGTTNSPYSVLKFTPTGTPANLYTGTLYLPYGLTLGTDGNFYGTALDAGSVSCGTVQCGYVFKITPTGTLTVLHNFTGGADGAWPYAPPVEGSDGNFYGTTSAGGDANACSVGPFAPGAGTVYKITPSGMLTTIHQFTSFDGCSPRSPLTLGTDGNFYGNTYSGGISAGHSCACGEVFRVTTAGKVTVLAYFDGTHGQNPIGPMVQASNGSFYGTTFSGGPSLSGNGVVFKMTPGGALTVVHDFTGAPDGSNPSNGVMQATDGDLYGTTMSGGTCSSGIGCGTIFRVTAAGVYSILYNFDGTTGLNPATAVFQHTNGDLYGATSLAGTHNFGVFYSYGLKLTPFISTLTNSGKAGQTIQILGQGLNGTTKVDFGTGSATFNVVSDTYMTAVVPVNGTTANVTVVTPTRTMVSSRVFRVIPAITSFSPPSGPVGTPVIITGTGLTQASRVTFGGIKATTFMVNSATQVTATVPNGARTGGIGILTPGGLGSSKKFSVTPVIASFSPPSGKVGTSVTINGTSFTSATKVTFDGVVSAFTVVSDIELTATVPTGAVTGKIAITTPGGTATSATNFTVTP